MSADTMALTVLCGIFAILVLIPMPWHLQSWNTATVLYMFWLSLAAGTMFINGIIWRNDAILRFEGFALFSVRVNASIAWAIPFCSLCLSRRLYTIAAVRSVTKTKGEKRREIVVDFFIAFVIPLVFGNVTQFINEGHRFNIFQGIGVIPFIYPTPMTLLFYIPPLLASFISASYSIRTFFALRRSYAQFKEFVSTSSNLNSSRYFRLMALAASDVFLCVPIQLVVIAQCAPFMKRTPWISWEDTHWGFKRVDQFSELQWANNPNMKFNAYCAKSLTIVACAAFFLFFGFADEAQKHYKMALTSMAKTLRISTAGTASTTESGTRWGSAVSGSMAKFKSASSSVFTKSQTGNSLPVYISTTTEKRTSVSSLTSISDSDAGSIHKKADDINPISKTQASTAPASYEDVSLPPMFSDEKNDSKV